MCLFPEKLVFTACSHAHDSPVTTSHWSSPESKRIHTATWSRTHQFYVQQPSVYSQLVWTIHTAAQVYCRTGFWMCSKSIVFLAFGSIIIKHSSTTTKHAKRASKRQKQTDIVSIVTWRQARLTLHYWYRANFTSQLSLQWSLPQNNLPLHVYSVRG